MYIWSVRRALHALRLGLSNEQRTRSFLVFFALIVLGLNLPIDSDARGWLGNDGFVKWLLYCAVAFAGVLATYLLNVKGDRQEFAPRFIALFVPLTLQSLVIVAIGLALAAFAPDRVSDSTISSFNKSSFWDLYWFGLQLFAEALLFLRLAINMHSASTSQSVT